MVSGALLLAAALLVYAQTAAFAWDEGFHLLAAQLIRNGRRPYLDFFFPQTPLNAYWNAAWMYCFGDTWRTAHTVAALCTVSAAFLVAEYLYRKFGMSAALCSLVVFGLNTLVFRFGGIGQAYGFCLLMLVAAFRCASWARERSAMRYAAASGLFASAAAAASLLTVPAIAVLLFWLCFYTRNIRKALAFVVAAAVPFAPVVILAMQAPREVLFQMFEYNFRYRAVLWNGDSAVVNNISVFKSFLLSPGALALVCLSLFAFVRARRTPDAVLCALMAIVLGVYIGAPFPTFARYFCFVVPFLTVLAVSALQGFPPERRNLATLTFSLLTVFSLARVLYAERGSYGWSKMEPIATKVNEVTAPGAAILADEQIYFLARRTPPSGLEHENSHKPLPLTPGFKAKLHIVGYEDIDRLTTSGAFKTVATCADEDAIDLLDSLRIYKHHADVGECTVYW